MDYYIISKIEFIEGAVIHTPVGYSTSVTDVDGLCTAYVDWVKSNVSELESNTSLISTFFEGHPVCHQVGWITTNIEGLLLPEITDFQSLE